MVSASFSGDSFLFIIASNIDVMVPFFGTGVLPISSVPNSLVLNLSLN